MARPIKTNYDFENTAKIVNLPDPTAAQDAATKAYVDAAIEGVNWKDSCRVSTQGNTTIASPGATIDGISMSSGDRVLVRAQSTASENGIYIWNGAAVPMTRSADASTSIELEQAVTVVEEGTNAGVSYRQTLVNFTLGSGSVAWTVFGAAAGAASETSAGIAEIATQAETDTGTDDLRIVTPLKLATWSGRIRKHSADFGDGSATQYDFTHNFNTEDVVVEVRQNSDDATVITDVRRTSANVVRVNVASAPASNALRIVIIG